MTARPSGIRLLQFLKNTARGIGAFATFIVIGDLASALIASATGQPSFRINGSSCTLLAGTAISVVLAVGSLSTGFRRKLAVIADRGGPVLYSLAALGGCLLIVVSTFWSYVSGWPYLVLLAIVSAAIGFAEGGVLALLACFAVGAFLAAAACIRISTGFLRAALKKPASADLSANAGDPWPIRAAAALMPPQAGCRWRDDFNEARYDYDENQHIRLLHDFLLHAPAVIFWAWGAVFDDIVSVSTSRGHR